MRVFRLLAAALICTAVPAFASVFAVVRGVVHDTQHRPVAGAAITLHATNSDFAVHGVSGQDGAFALPEAPIGVYRLEVSAPGFAAWSEPVTLVSGTNPAVHVELAVGGAAETVVVQGSADAAVDTATPTTLITRAQIEETPGASHTLSMAMITNYVPGSYMTHDMLHMRGGHQTTWLIDGVAIPNTKIASNVGPQIDPGDIDSLETQRGSYAADVGDRTYGVFNVLPRNGFERESRWRTVCVWRQPLQRRGAAFLGRSLGEDGVVCEWDGIAVELWAGYAGAADFA